MKYTHILRPENNEPGFSVVVIEDANNTPYVPGSTETLANGAIAWDGRDVYLSFCPGCAATPDQSPCAQRIMLRDLDEVVIHESDAAQAKAKV